MIFIKTSLSLLLCLIAISGYSQPKYDISAPVDISSSGIYKVWCMSNGNTMLFCFQERKGIVVKVFDSLHEEIASKKHICNVYDINDLEGTSFAGMFEIDGKAVYFMEQKHLSKKRLIRMTFNATTGDLEDEKVVAEISFGVLAAKNVRFHVMPDKNNKGYSILSIEDEPNFQKCKITVTYYNNLHEQTKVVDIPVDRKSFDYLNILSASSQYNGTCITFSLDKMIDNATTNYHSMKSATYDHILLIVYIPENGTQALERPVDLGKVEYPKSVMYTYNPFADKLNLLLSCLHVSSKDGLSHSDRDVFTSFIFVTVDPSDMSIKYNSFVHDSATHFYRSRTDTSNIYAGIPEYMFTNENGLTTIISQSFQRFNGVFPNGKYGIAGDFYGNIAITQCDDDGKEMWGTMLPLQQFTGSDDGAVYFSGIKAFGYKGEIYIVYNDYHKNFNNNITHVGDTVYNYANTEACIYKMSKKKEIKKSVLFGEEGYNEVAFMGGASNVDQKRGIYATLLECVKTDKTVLCMGWRKLE